MSRHGSLAWHEGAASRNNEPNKYNEFKYDNEHNKIFSILEQINTVTRRIQDDTADVVRGINRLDNLYGSCTDYDEYVKDMKNIIMMRSSELADTNKKVMNNVSTSINSLTEKDTKLLNDIDLLNQMMKRS